MIGAIAGDIIGSVYEWRPVKTKEFPLFQPGSRFTDDTVLTCAVADSLLTRRPYGEKLREYYHYYPEAGYGGKFAAWAAQECMAPYNSWGNGSAMRVSPIGFAGNSLEEVLAEAKESALVTHNHPEGVKGAQAAAAAVLLARQRRSKADMKSYLEKQFGYNLSQTLAEIRPDYTFDVSCQGTLPAAILAFLEATDFEDAVRNAVSLGGDSDTLACITGAIAQAYYGVPENIRAAVLKILDQRLRQVVFQFETVYMV